jgi:CBS domain-containing protein
MSLNSLIKMPNVITLSPKATVSEAAKKMAEHLVGSVIVLEGDKLVGIFTERDLLNRVVAKDLDPKTTPLAQVMSKNVRSVPVEETVENLYNKMQETRCRHIPIVDGPRVVGVVTMRGILEWLTQEIKEENLFLKNYIQS